MGAMQVYTSAAMPLQALVCVLILFLLLPTLSQSDPIYQICSPAQLACGERSIDSVVAPFRTDEQPTSCGRQSFRLFCHGEYPAMQINSTVYWVQEINYQTMMLTLVNLDFVGTLCPSEFTTTDPDISPFTFHDDVRRVTIRHSCSCISAGYYFWALPCRANASDSYAYLAAEPFTSHPYRGCSCRGDAVNLALRQSEFEELAKRGSIGRESFMKVLLHGFKVRWPVAYVDCKVCKESGGECKDNGYLAGQKICSCQGGSYNPMCPPPGTTLGIGGFFILSLLLLCLSVHFCRCKLFFSNQVMETKKKLKQSKFIEAFLKSYGFLAPKRYSYSELQTMTSSFSDTIGKGGFTRVFKGKFLDGRSVAVKVLEASAKCNGKVFVNEVVSIGWTYHVNIVGLLGYCLEGPVRALIYEFMPNGSLEKFIFGDRRGTLGWEKLYERAVGIARGLEYLHRGCQMSILHFDIKPHNILLDHDFFQKYLILALLSYVEWIKMMYRCQVLEELLAT